MAKFTYSDMVRVRVGVPKEMRPGAKGWIVGVVETGERQGRHFDQFVPGPVYTIEFEDGTSTDIGESSLELPESGKDALP